MQSSKKFKFHLGCSYHVVPTLPTSPNEFEFLTSRPHTEDDAPLTLSGLELGAALQHLRPNGGLRELVADSLDDRGLFKLLVNQGRHIKVRSRCFLFIKTF